MFGTALKQLTVKQTCMHACHAQYIKHGHSDFAEHDAGMSKKTHEDSV